jgi:hypothetical protein
MEPAQISSERHDQIMSGASAPRTLDELAALDHQELLKLYARATVPSDMTTLDGKLIGRMLAVRGTEHGPIHELVELLGAWPGFPWHGKTLHATSATEGTGINRVDIPALGKRDLYPFKTQFDRSALDGKPCVFINYDSDENPVYIRAIRDEVRQIAPGLFFGPVLIRHGKELTQILWFGIQVPPAQARANA